MDNEENINSKPQGTRMNRPMKGPMAGPVIGEKSKDFKKSMTQLIKYCKPYLIAIIIAIIFAIVSSICSIIGPDYLSEITNEITKGLMTKINLESIKKIGYFLIALYVASAILGYAQGFIMTTITNKFSKKLRAEISTKINHLPLRYFDKHSYGDILSRVTNDVDTISQTMNNSIGTLVSSVALFLGSLIMMFTTNWQMAVTAVLSTVIGFGLQYYQNHKNILYHNKMN